MYIGPWQEFKLAKLIQQHQQQQERPGSRQRRPLVPRQNSKSDICNDDAVSVTSSTRSGVSYKSTQSAPQPSAQSRLNEFYEHYERSARHDDVSNAASNRTDRTRRLPPRPQSSSRPKAVAKRRPKAKSAPSFEEERRARIQHMKSLYGLGPPCAEVQPSSASNASESMSRVDSAATLRLVDDHIPPAPRLPPAAVVAANSFTPDFDRALIELQASMDVRGEIPFPEPTWETHRGQVDPLAMSLSAESMGGSGGLIAWSKNLRPEDLSPDLTLAGFLLPC